MYIVIRCVDCEGYTVVGFDTDKDGAIGLANDLAVGAETEFDVSHEVHEVSVGAVSITYAEPLHEVKLWEPL